ncbi:MAG: hypothetical protein OXF23_03155 [Candidatus Dadabacteria bacterium]|nr:hypothetical protein [Candidatus Dadabacteria bacterium]
MRGMTEKEIMEWSIRRRYQDGEDLHVQIIGTGTEVFLRLTLDQALALIADNEARIAVRTLPSGVKVEILEVA